MNSLRNAAVLGAGACALSCSIVTDLSDVSPAVYMSADAAVDSPVSVICNLSGDVNMQPGCVASDADGVFVSDKGNDASAGTKSAPLKSMNAALAAAVAAKRPYVYACGGVYAGSVEVSSLVNIFGSFDCATWSPAPSGEPTTRIVASKPAYGVLITASHVSMARVAIAGLDAQLPGESSFGVVVAGAQDVNLISVSIDSGAGKDGSAGEPVPNYNSKILGSDPSIAGNAPVGAQGGMPHACMLCADGKNSVGGGGGNASSMQGTAGGSGLPAAKFSGIGGAGAPPSGMCFNGTVGAGGAAGADADPTAATSYGAIVNGVWMPASGAPGKNGVVAQGGGGGGGGSGTVVSGGGSGGGCGGCGGGGGSGGSGGGASVGLLMTEVVVNNVAVDSQVSVRLSVIKSLGAGAGGAGLLGQIGQSGGMSSKAPVPGCSGSGGGTGGAGGAGAGGAGGLSAGVAWHGKAAPVIDAFTTTHITPGAAGKPGVGGRPGVTDGIPAVSAQVVHLTL